jgi:hypothetical protein
MLEHSQAQSVGLETGGSQATETSLERSSPFPIMSKDDQKSLAFVSHLPDYEQDDQKSVGQARLHYDPFKVS